MEKFPWVECENSWNTNGQCYRMGLYQSQYPTTVKPRTDRKGISRNNIPYKHYKEFLVADCLANVWSKGIDIDNSINVLRLEEKLSFKSQEC